MALAAGTRIGGYEILASLGEGGTRAGGPARRATRRHRTAGGSAERRARTEQDIERRLEEERAARQRAEEALARQPAPVRAWPPVEQPAPRRCLTRLDAGEQVPYVLSKPRTSIGRTPENDLQVHENYISRSHAVVRLGPDSAVVEDQGSRNGVFVNDHRVTRERLRDGDILMFGKARFRFHLEPPCDAARS